MSYVQYIVLRLFQVWFIITVFPFLLPRSWFKLHWVMVDEPAAEIQLLRSLKAKLIDILSRTLCCSMHTLAACCRNPATSGWRRAVFQGRRWRTCWITSSREGLKQHGDSWSCWRTRTCRKPSHCFVLLRICKSLQGHQIGTKSAPYLKQSYYYTLLASKVFSVHITRSNKDEKASTWNRGGHPSQKDLQKQWVTRHSELFPLQPCYIITDSFFCLCLVAQDLAWWQRSSWWKWSVPSADLGERSADWLWTSPLWSWSRLRRTDPSTWSECSPCWGTGAPALPAHSGGLGTATGATCWDWNSFRVEGFYWKICFISQQIDGCSILVNIQHLFYSVQFLSFKWIIYF